MDDVLKEIFGGDTDHEAAGILAKRVAELLGAKAVSNEVIVVDEPYFPFKISFRTKEFNCVLSISDVCYGFEASRRPKTPWADDFLVSLKEPAVSTRLPVPKLSKNDRGQGVLRSLLSG